MGTIHRSSSAQRASSQAAPHGPAVGIVPDVEYRIGQVTLEPGDVLFAFTDGVTDTRDPSRDLFTDGGCWPSSSNQPTRSQALLDRVDEALHADMAGSDQFDDTHDAGRPTQRP